MDNLINLKTTSFIAISAIGSIASPIFGGFDKLLIAFLICMIADYVSGLITALIFKNSPKTPSGTAESKAGLIGLLKKVFILIIIVVGNQIDIVLGAGGFIRNAIIIGFIANEVLSLVENAGLMGIKLPPALINSIEILKKKSEEKIQK